MLTIHAIGNYENDIGISHTVVWPALSLEIPPLYFLFINRVNNGTNALDKDNRLVSFFLQGSLRPSYPGLYTRRGYAIQQRYTTSNTIDTNTQTIISQRPFQEERGPKTGTETVKTRSITARICRMGICEECCFTCDTLVTNARRWRYRAGPPPRGTCCAQRWGRWAPDEVRKCLTACVACFRLLDS